MSENQAQDQEQTQAEERCNCANCQFNRSLPAFLGTTLTEDKATILHSSVMMGLQSVLHAREAVRRDGQVALATLFGNEQMLREVQLEAILEHFMENPSRIIDLYNGFTHLLAVFSDKFDWKLAADQLERCLRKATEAHPKREGGEARIMPPEGWVEGWVTTYKKGLDEVVAAGQARIERVEGEVQITQSGMTH